MSGDADDCVWCQDGTGRHWHRRCWDEAHDYFRGEEDSA